MANYINSQAVTSITTSISETSISDKSYTYTLSYDPIPEVSEYTADLERSIYNGAKFHIAHSISLENQNISASKEKFTKAILKDLDRFSQDACDFVKNEEKDNFLNSLSKMKNSDIF